MNLTAGSNLIWILVQASSLQSKQVGSVKLSNQPLTAFSSFFLVNLPSRNRRAEIAVYLKMKYLHTAFSATPHSRQQKENEIHLIAVKCSNKSITIKPAICRKQPKAKGQRLRQAVFNPCQMLPEMGFYEMLKHEVGSR